MPAWRDRETLSMSEVIRSKRGQAVLISLQNDPDCVGGKTVRWTVLSGEGHCASAMAGRVGVSRRFFAGCLGP
jgi:hypothetical protein